MISQLLLEFSFVEPQLSPLMDGDVPWMLNSSKRCPWLCVSSTEGMGTGGQPRGPGHCEEPRAVLSPRDGSWLPGDWK